MPPLSQTPQAAPLRRPAITRSSLPAVLFLLLSGLAHAATPDDAGGERAARLAKAREQISARFEKADANHDGKLSRAEAEAGMPRVAQAFDRIDADAKGYVTLDEISAYLREEMMKRRVDKAR